MKQAHHEPTQCDYIIAHLKTGKGITQREADRLYGIGRLAARIGELKRNGYPEIQHETIEVKKRNGARTRVTRYYLPR